MRIQTSYSLRSSSITIYDAHHVSCQGSIFNWEDRIDESDEGTSGGEPGEDRRGCQYPVSQARLRRNRGGRHHESRRTDSWRLLWPLRVERRSCRGSLYGRVESRVVEGGAEVFKSRWS